MSVYDVIRQLPDIATVRDRSRALAMLDAVSCPDWRFHSYDPAWSETAALASMRDGMGNDYSIVFSPAGAYARGFDHESPMTPWRETPMRLWPGLVESVPPAFRPLLAEPSFCEADGTHIATVCFWRETADSAWRTGAVELPPDAVVDDEDGASWLFEFLVGDTALGYQKFAEEVYQTTPELTAIEHVLRLNPLTDDVAAALNPAIRLADLAAEIAAIGYPNPLILR